MVELLEEENKDKNIIMKKDLRQNKDGEIKSETIPNEEGAAPIENLSDEYILENVKITLRDVISLVEKNQNNYSVCSLNNESDQENKGVLTITEENENLEIEMKHKGILKHERTYSNKHVDFDLALEYIPFDPKRDYTIDIQFVETIQKKVVSYAALFAQKKKKAEEEATDTAPEVNPIKEHNLVLTK